MLRATGTNGERLNHKIVKLMNNTKIFIFIMYCNVEHFRTKTVETARAQGEKVRLTGAAEARAIEAVGR